MKKLRFGFLTLAAISLTALSSAQTADEVIAGYLNAIGGKDKIASINSLIVESTLDVMGTTGNVKLITLNGKGMRQDIDVMGAIMTTCYNATDGWSINPMMGSSTAETMPDVQYKAGKSNIWIEGPFTGPGAEGYKAELLGKESAAGVECNKIKFTSPDNVASTYYFDAANSLLVRTVNVSEMQGQMMETTMTFSDYQDTDGYKTARKMEMDLGGQFQMTMNVTKVNINPAVDEAIFKKP